MPKLELDDRELGVAVEEGRRDLFRAMAVSLPGAELVEHDGLSMHHPYPESRDDLPSLSLRPWPAGTWPRREM